MNEKKHTISRRDFLKTSTIIATSVPLLSIGFEGKLKKASAAEIKKIIDYGKGDWIYSACNMCGGQSGIKVLVQDGVVRKIEPNDENPIGVCNISTDYEVEKKRGARICPKGNSGTHSLYDADRVKTPMKNIGKRGEGKWEAITWEKAISEIAEKLTEIKNKNGAESLVWFSEDHSFTHPQVDFCNLFGTPNYMNHSNLCDVARKRGFSTVMGDERPLPDFQNAKYSLIFGWNPLGAMKFAHLPAIINRGREKGMKLVVVDPVFSQTAVKSDEWIPIRPGTDGAFALALANVIISQKLYDKKFIDEWTIGFDKFVEFVKDKTPEWAEKITSIPVATIKRIAKEISQSKQTVIDAWSGPGHHTNATQGVRAIAMLSALLGLYDKPGTMMTVEKKGNKHRSLSFDKSTKPRLDGFGTKYPFGHKSGIYIEARDNMITGQPYQVKAAFFVFQNWVMSVPNTKKNTKAINNMELVVVVDTHLSETAMLADYIIPGSNYLERYDFTGNWTTWPTTSLRQPVVKSWINGVSEAEFVMALGRKLGLKDKDGVGFEMTYEELLSDEAKLGMGITLDEMKKLPGAVFITGATRYEKYNLEVTPPEGSTTDATTGVVKGPDGKYVGVKIGEKVLKGVATPSGKFEFYSAALEKASYNPLPEYTEPEDNPTSNYPLYFVAWKQAEHTHTRTFNNDWLMEMKGDNPLYINSATAKKLGIEEGDQIMIESPVAKNKATAHITEGIHPEVVGFQHGFGHWALGKIAKGKGTADGQFLPGKAEKISGQAVSKEIGVKIYKA